MQIKDFRETVLEQFDGKLSKYESQINSDIEKYKKGNCVLKLVGKDGNPLANTHIKINQTGHDFKYGANIFLLDEFKTAEENEKYRDMFHKFFNMATVPFYWSELEPQQGKPRFAADSPKIYRRPAPDLCLDYCNEKGIAAKLHCLFYDKFTPEWLPKRDSAEMKRLYEKRFAEIAERYYGKMYEYEVTNELLDEHRWTGAIKGSVLCEEHDTPLWCYQTARKYFPEGTLVLNEAQRLPELAQKDYRSEMYMFVENLLLRGAPIDKIGVQHHIFCGKRGPQETELPKFMHLFDPENIMEGLRYMAEFGKPMEITEVTIPTFGESDEAEQLQADLLRNMYRMWFSAPLMETVMYWNTVEGTAYKVPNDTADENLARAGLFHRDFTPKKSALVLRDLFEKEWHTELEAQTDENGVVSFRGFYGNYEVCADGEKSAFGIHKNSPEMTVAML